MSETVTIVVSIVGAAVGIVGVLGLMLRILTTNVTREFESTARQLSDLHGRIGGVAAEMRQRFDRVHQELAENRERMAKLEGALEGFLAGRRDRDAA